MSKYLIDEWRQWYRLATIRLFIFIGFIPDLYQAVSSMGLLEGMPQSVSLIFRTLAIVGIGLRLYKQGGSNAAKS